VKLQAEISGLRTELDRSGRFGEMWGGSPSMKRVYEQVSRVAATAVTVLIQGESGTGKETRSADHPFTQPPTGPPFPGDQLWRDISHLMESEIFGT
jgi:transcriptional regulator of aromatic amino acid metabolism